MTVPADTTITYDAKGNREDLVDAIYMVEQERVPFTASIPKITALATLHEWQKQDLADSADDNAQLEGDDATNDAFTPTERLGNYTQISRKTCQVAGTQEAVNKAGRDSEMAHQKQLKAREMVRDIEKSALANKAKNAGAAGTARVAAGVESWIASNTSEGIGATSATGDGTDARVAGTLRPFDEADLKAVLADVATAGGNPNLMLVGAFNKQAMSAFSGNGMVRNQEASTKTLNTAIDIYVSDFGTLTVKFSPQSNPSSAIAIDTSLWALCHLPGRNMKSKPLAENGDSMREMLISEWTIESRDEEGNGAVYDLTVA